MLYSCTVLNVIIKFRTIRHIHFTIIFIEIIEDFFYVLKTFYYFITWKSAIYIYI